MGLFSFWREVVMVRVLIGDMFKSNAQTLVNTVNTVGVMGKGVALAFRQHFPDMYEDYVRRCERGEVRLGEPYLYRRITPPNIINFPTKDHWRSVSRLEDIVKGLRKLQENVREWDISSLAVPPLGCGEGQLEWRVVGPTLFRHLSQLGVPVELYAPFGTPHEELNPEYLKERAVAMNGHKHEGVPAFRVEPGWVALVAIMDLVTHERYHWPVGRVGFQKVAYFATEAGIPTGLTYRQGSYGPYSPDVKKVVMRLVNNGLIAEKKLGRMLATSLGPTYRDAKSAYEPFLNEWQSKILSVADLIVRMNTEDAELAATVHFAAKMLGEKNSSQPNETDVLHYVQEWKQRRRPPLKEADIALAIRRLNLLGWLDVAPSADLPIQEELMTA
jgi:O-acetyl-ADP-ribose deacetylase (regulator of RNase III)/uncharacterized protein YwgA